MTDVSNSNVLRMMKGPSPGRGWEFFYSPKRPDRPWSPAGLLSNGYKGLFPWGYSGRGKL